MKIIKKLFLVLFILIVLVLIAAVAIPYFYKDEIVDMAKTEINKTINADVNFNNVSLSLFKNFPNFTLGLDDFSVKGRDDFQDVTLVSTKSFQATLDLMSVIKSDIPVKIKGIHLVEPLVNIIVLKNGKANYDITKPSEATTTSESTGKTVVSLEEYSIQNGKIIYDDRKGGMYLNMTGLNHNGSGDIDDVQYDLRTKTAIDAMTVRMGNMNYLKKARTTLDAIFAIDMQANKYTLKENKFKINDLSINLDGFVQMENDDINMNIDFGAPSNSFKSVLSLIPGAYIKGYESVKANGDFKLNGFVKGTLNEKSIPKFQIYLDVKDADFQYPDLPMGIKNINTKIAINSPSSNLDRMTIDVSNFAMNLGNNPFSAVLHLKTPISDPDIDTKIKGVIDLSDLSKAFPMEGVKELSGIINADLVAKARMSDMDRKDYENINMSGSMVLSKMNYDATDMPLVHINSMMMNFSPKFVKVDNFDAKLGKSDIKASGRVDNILAWFSPEKTMTGDLVFQSNYFDANEWLADENSTDTPSQATPSDTTAVFDRFDFKLDGKINKLEYDTYTMTNNSLKGQFSPSSMEFQSFTTQIGKSDLSGSGNVKNVFAYLFDNEMITGDIKINSSFFDMNQFMTAEPVAETTTAPTNPDDLEPFLVPDNMKMNIAMNFKKLLYTDMVLDNLKGNIVVENKTASIKNAVTNTLGGQFGFEGTYDTKEKEKPTFDMAYNIKKMDFSKAFSTFNSIEKLAPIGKFIEGKFNSTMTMKGVLGKDMMPDLNTLTIDGFLNTIEAVIRNFKPLEKLGNSLNIDYFKSMKIKNSKNWFEIKNGMVTLKEFPYKYKDIDMVVGGKHGLTSDMDYNIKARIPRKLLEKGKAGKAVNTGIKLLESKASKLGINLKAGAFINTLINITGTITDPKISIKPLSSDGEDLSVKNVVENVVNQVKDTVKQVITKKVEVVKEDYKKKADAEIKKVMDAAQKQANRVKKEGKKRADQAKKLAYDKADELVSKAGINPLKKMAAKTAAKVAKKQADKVHKKAIDKTNQQADKIMDKANKQADGIRKKYKDK